MLKPGFEETEENLINLMESRLQDHERIRGGLYFIQAIPRDENWKVRRDILQTYEPKKPEECTLNVSASLAQQVADSPKLCKKMVQELERQPNGTFVATPLVTVQASSPRTKRVAHKAIGKVKRIIEFLHFSTFLIEEPIGDAEAGNSRRGSMDCILEDKVSNPNLVSSASSSGTRGGARRGSRVASLGGGSRGSSRRGSTDLPDNPPTSSLDSIDKSNTFSYWFKVTVVPSVSISCLVIIVFKLFEILNRS